MSASGISTLPAKIYPSDWRLLADLAAHESDPEKLLRIVQELCVVLDKRERELRDKSRA